MDVNTVVVGYDGSENSQRAIDATLVVLNDEHFIDDDPASAILHTADEVGADMIVVGSRGLGRAARVLRGSVSTKIAHHSHVDFMVIH